MLNQKSNISIFQIEGSKLDMHGFLDYLKSSYPVINNKYLMIKIGSVNISNTALDSVFINMIQLASMAGHNYVMIMI